MTRGGIIAIGIVGVTLIGVVLSIVLPLTLIKSNTDLELLVYCEDGKTVENFPITLNYEIPDELWEVPRYISKDVKFDKGIIEVLHPGHYNLNTMVSFYIDNGSSETVAGTAYVRIIQGDIVDRFDYDIKDILSINTFPGLIEPYTQYPGDVKNFVRLTLPNNVNFEITEEDIEHGRNKIAPQYIFTIFLYEGQEIPEGMVISRDTNHVKTFLSLTKI